MRLRHARHTGTPPHDTERERENTSTSHAQPHIHRTLKTTCARTDYLQVRKYKRPRAPWPPYACAIHPPERSRTATACAILPDPSRAQHMGASLSIHLYLQVQIDIARLDEYRKLVPAEAGPRIGVQKPRQPSHLERACGVSAVQQGLNLEACLSTARHDHAQLVFIGLEDHACCIARRHC